MNTIRNYIKLVEAVVYDDRFRQDREDTFGNKVNGLLTKARGLADELAALNVAPSAQVKLNDAMRLVTGYLNNLEQHAAGLPKRQNPVPGFD